MKWLITLLFIPLSFAIDCSSFEELPIQQNGRTKPLYVHANQSIKYLTGKSRVGELSALQYYCDLSLSVYLGTNPQMISASVEHVDLKKLLEVKKSISFENLSQKIDRLRVEARKLSETESSYKKAVTKILSKYNLYQDIKSGMNWFLPVPADQNGTEISWTPLGTLMGDSRFPELKNNLPRFLSSINEEYKKRKGDDHLLELFYFKSNVYKVTMLVVLIAMALLVMVKNSYVGLSFAVLSVALQIGAITLRILISGRAPVTNMYETVLFSGLGGLVIALIIGHLRKEKLFVLGALGYNFLCLFMLIFANGMLQRDIGPLVPVLRDNFWLSTHVTTVILSYAAYAVAWMMANTTLVKKAFFTLSKEEFRYQTDLIYSCLKVGSTLLALGIILGGVWADYSWGRFWGWDPKETWSAIALLIYLAILHGRYTKWINDDRFVLASAAAFMSIMMAWFGVNYILASGLHSYGFSEGGFIFLMSFFAIQTSLLLITHFKTKATLV